VALLVRGIFGLVILFFGLLLQLIFALFSPFVLHIICSFILAHYTLSYLVIKWLFLAFLGLISVLVYCHAFESC